MRNDWLRRETKQLIQNTDPSDMAARFGEIFTDADGKPTSTATTIYDPDLSAVTGFPSKYWTITADTVALKSQAERDAVDAAEAQAAIDADKTEQKARMDNERLLKGMAIYFAKELNKLRAALSLPPLTVSDVRNGIKAEVDNV